MNRFARFLLLLALSLLMSACGGGSSDDGASDTSSEQHFTLSGNVRPEGYVATGIAASAWQTPLSGHLSLPEGDDMAVYEMELTAGEAVQLLLSDPDQGDLDLFLTDDLGDLVQASQGSGAAETVRAPAAGSYSVTVQAVSGASGYRLQTGDQIRTFPSVGVTQDFVPGEVIVRYKEESPSLLSVGGENSVPGLRRKGGGRGRAMLYEVPATVSSQGLAKDHPLIDESRPDISRKMDTIRALKQLRSDPSVRYAEPNYRMRAQFIPNDPGYGDQWASPLIHLPEAWDITRGTPETVVAVVDSGVMFDHPDLKPNLLNGYDFVSDQTASGDNDGIDPDTTDDGAALTPEFTYHGTHVAGTIAAVTDNGTGVAGVAGGVRILPLRAMAGNDGNTYDISQAIRYAAGLPNDSGTVPQQRADVINLSLGGPASIELHDACVEARNEGVVLVASAGNDGTSDAMYPAAYPEVLSISAVDASRQLASYSSHGPTISVAAPGGDEITHNFILSTHWDYQKDAPDYLYMVGTSMAAPHVSGVIALMRSLAPSMTPDQVDSLLASGALTDDIGDPGRDDSFGYGLINAYKAVQAAQQVDAQISPAPTATPTVTTGSEVYVLLTDAEGHTVAQAQGTFGAEGLAFTLTDLPSGEYRLFAGADSDGNGTLCDEGEVCGTYPDLQSAQSFVLDADRTNLEIYLNLTEGLPSGIPFPRLK